MNCLVCDAQLPAPASVGRPRRYCSAACRQRAYHARHAGEQQIHTADGERDKIEAGCKPNLLLTAIVFVPVDGADAVFTAQPFSEFPWEEFLTAVGEQRNNENSLDESISRVVSGTPDAFRHEAAPIRNDDKICKPRGEIPG
jgi:hypothetical protein